MPSSLRYPHQARAPTAEQTFEGRRENLSPANKAATGWFASANNGDTLGHFPTPEAARQGIQAAVLADNETDE